MLVACRGQMCACVVVGGGGHLTQQWGAGARVRKVPGQVGGGGGGGRQGAGWGGGVVVCLIVRRCVRRCGMARASESQTGVEDLIMSSPVCVCACECECVRVCAHACWRGGWGAWMWSEMSGSHGCVIATRCLCAVVGVLLLCASSVRVCVGGWGGACLYGCLIDCCVRLFVRVSVCEWACVCLSGRLAVACGHRCACEWVWLCGCHVVACGCVGVSL